jgi:predicted ester cyclase
MENPGVQRNLHQFVEEVVEEVYNKRNFRYIREAFAEDLTNHTAPPELAPGREGYELYVAFLLRNYSDMTVTADDIVVEGDKIVLRWTLRGTLTGAFEPPYRGTSVEYSGVTVERVGDDGKIIEIWNYVNDLEIVEKFGIAVPKAPIPPRKEGLELIREIEASTT